MADFINDQDGKGRRARLRPKPAAVQKEKMLDGNILSPLKQTNGMVWPYQPTINYTQQVDYQAVPLVHTNQDFYAFTRSPTPELQVEGEFTVQNQSEGIYALACIHFLRTVTKMYFGTGAHLGVPPPVLLFDAFGKYMFNKLPVIVTAFTANMVKEVDYVAISVKGAGGTSGTSGYSNIVPDTGNHDIFGTNNSANNEVPTAVSGSGSDVIWLPSLFNISVTMKVQNTPARLTQFDLDKFRTGDLLKSGGWL